MKTGILILVAAAVCGLAPTGRAQQLPAYDALRTVGRLKGDALLSELVEARGSQGDPQPVQWVLTFKDAAARGGTREFVVTKKGIVSERAPVAGAGAPSAMAAAGLNLDSTGAFAAANKEAAKMKMGFYSVNYELSNKAGKPVWTVRLYDAQGVEAAAVEVSAKDGLIVSPLRKTEGSVASATTAPGASPSHAAAASSDSLGERWVEGGGLVGHVGRWSERAWKDTSKTAVKVGDSVEAFFVGRPAKE
jgi:hypothetical protein